MPLPAGNTTWPPKALDGILDVLATHSAWYEGDPSGLRNIYRRQVERPSTRPSQWRGGVVGAVSRFFWGNPAPTGQARETQLHVPIAADICQASADLLFAEPPSIEVDEGEDGGPVTDRLAELVDDHLLTTLAEAAEVGAALSGSFLRVTWDLELAPAPFLTTLHMDAALPDFRHGRLTAVTFWWVVREDNNRVWRHLERHELVAGVGVIEHGLFVGTVDNLGTRIPLTEHPSTEMLQVDEFARISTESPGLAVVFIPNQRPNRRWRSHPLGAAYGRSDLDGTESLMDALDEVYSSWMRDVRLAKSRIIVPEYMLDFAPGGMGATFDTDREVYSTLNAPPLAQATSMQILAQQFSIRFAEHQGTAQDLVEQILRTAGYSPGTFGEGPEGMLTATEVTARVGRSYLTRDRKARLWKPAAETIIEKLLAVDAALFNGPGVLPVTVQFGDSVQDSQLVLAQTAQALRTAEAASTRTLVAMNHPDWDAKQIDDEVALIASERPAAPASPFGDTFGGASDDAAVDDEAGASA